MLRFMVKENLTKKSETDILFKETGHNIRNLHKVGQAVLSKKFLLHTKTIKSHKWAG